MNNIKELYKTVQHRDKAIEYRANIQMGACNFEFFVNDIPVDQYFDNANGTFNSSSPVNDAILESGTQRWKLVVYPGYKDDVLRATLSPNVLIEIELEGLRHHERGVTTVVPPVLLIATPQQKNEAGEATYTDAGKTIMTYEGTFDAQVPYTLTGWSESEDLRKADPVQLEQELIAFYEKYSGYYRNHNLENILQTVYDKEQERAQYFFLDASGSAETLREYSAFLSFPDPKVLPIEHYRLRFYGDGKIVTLERSDFPNIGEPVTRIEFYDDRKQLITEYMFGYLHKKKGSAELEMIR